MSIKIGINGFGRIGRNLLRISLLSDKIDVVAINDIADRQTCAHLLKYDSVFGVLENNVSHDSDGILIDGKRIKIFSERSPSDIGWSDEGCQIVVESTGIFTSKELASQHLGGNVKKVIISAPGKGDIDFTTVMGANDDLYDNNQHHIVSNASCTTNCLAPIAKVLNDRFGIESGLMTTIHAYTNDQSILDAPHSDLRRARSAAVSQIPTTTGAAKAVGKVIPELNGKMDGMAIRIPTPTGSLVDLVVNLKTEASKDEINAAMKEAAEGPMKGILEYQEDPIVSVDIIHNTHSSIYDKESLMIQGKTVKVLAWYDNEWGYSCRVVDLIDLFNL